MFILLSAEYRVRFAANLKKELARIPVVSSFEDFKTFSAAGQALADLHLNYEKDAAAHHVDACEKLGVRVVESKQGFVLSDSTVRPHPREFF